MLWVFTPLACKQMALSLKHTRYTVSLTSTTCFLLSHPFAKFTGGLSQVAWITQKDGDIHGGPKTTHSSVPPKSLEPFTGLLHVNILH